MKFTAIHAKMARAALGLGVRELAEVAKVSPDTIARLERGEDLKQRTIEAIQKILEEMGVQFRNGGEPTVGLAAPDVLITETDFVRSYSTFEEERLSQEFPGLEIERYVDGRMLRLLYNHEIVGSAFHRAGGTYFRPRVRQTDAGNVIERWAVVALERAGHQFASDGQPERPVRGQVYRLTAVPNASTALGWALSTAERLLWTRADNPDRARRNAAGKTFIGGKLEPGSRGVTSPWLDETLVTCVIDASVGFDVPFGALVTSAGELVGE